MVFERTNANKKRKEKENENNNRYPTRYELEETILKEGQEDNCPQGKDTKEDETKDANDSGNTSSSEQQAIEGKEGQRVKSHRRDNKQDGIQTHS